MTCARWKQAALDRRRRAVARMWPTMERDEIAKVIGCKVQDVANDARIMRLKHNPDVEARIHAQRMAALHEGWAAFAAVPENRAAVGRKISALRQRDIFRASIGLRRLTKYAPRIVGDKRAITMAQMVIRYGYRRTDDPVTLLRVQTTRPPRVNRYGTSGEAYLADKYKIRIHYGRTFKMTEVWKMRQQRRAESWI